MATIKPFHCIRPNESVVSKVAALPYDVYDRREAKIEVEKEPLSFLKIDRAETGFEDSVDTYDDRVYQEAKKLLDGMIADGTFVTETKECYYVYELIMEGRSQTGLVACAAIDDYLSNTIKKHENTREEKEIDRIKHVDSCNAQTGPIFLAYRSREVINLLIEKIKKEQPLYDFVATDGIGHKVWKIEENEDVLAISEGFSKIESIYIADGHHRAASAVKVGLKRRKENPGYQGNEEFNYFLSVLFPHDQLMIMSYNRVVQDLNGFTKQELLEKIEDHFDIKVVGKEPFAPARKGTFGMYLDQTWYQLEAKSELLQMNDPVESLDVSILQNYLLQPVLGIEDPRIDKRIDFIGGIRGLGELEKRVNEGMAIAFSLYPTSIVELFSVSDADKLMPPKSTWFEPKLRSGVFIHKLS